MGILFQSTKPYRLRRSEHTAKVLCGLYFNPRSRIGFDHKQMRYEGIIDIFQSTKPYRLRLGNAAAERGPCTSFQSTKPYRLRRQRRTGMKWRNNFNPRSRIGFDFLYLLYGIVFFDFNPRSRIGFDTTAGYKSSAGGNFNPRSRIGFDSAMTAMISG